MTKYPISLTFIEPWAAKKEVPYVRAQPDPGFSGRNFDMIDYNVNITDARPMKDQFKLDVNGFEFIEDAQSSTPELLDALRGNDKATIEKLYYPQVERIVKEMTKATRVFTFDHTVRRRVRSAGEKGPYGKEKIAPVLNGQEQPAKLVSHTCIEYQDFVSFINNSAQVHCDQYVTVRFSLSYFRRCNITQVNRWRDSQSAHAYGA